MKKRVYIFFRDGVFYPLQLLDDADAIKNAEWNPGTIRVEDHNGRIVWKAPLESANVSGGLNAN